MTILARERMAVLLPAWRPGEELAALVEELAAAGFGAVVVVDDGSGAGYLGVLARVESMARVHVVRHKRRCGKGRALKTGTGYVLGSLEEMEGLITADADGRHSVADVARVAEAFSWTLIGAGGRVVLGVRNFAGGVGWGRRAGSWVMRRLFARVTGVRLADTQTGLRGFPRRMLPELLALGGEGCEYETAALAWVCREGDAPVETPIETARVEGKRSLRFDAVVGAVRVCGVVAGLGWARWGWGGGGATGLRGRMAR